LELGQRTPEIGEEVGSPCGRQQLLGLFIESAGSATGGLGVFEFLDKLLGTPEQLLGGGASGLPAAVAQVMAAAAEKVGVAGR